MPKTLLKYISEKKYWPLWLFISLLIYGVLAYAIDRTQFYTLLFLWGAAFVAYVVLCRAQLSIPRVILLALSFRLVFLFSMPTLSDDFFRFIWDGKLIINGQNPYSSLPAEVAPSLQKIIDEDGILLKNMNSTQYYSVYPPLHQFVFVVSAALGQSLFQSVVVMRFILILFDMALIGLLVKLLLQLKLSTNRVALYALNPLVIVEVAGNLHFESLMMTFFIWGVIVLFNGNSFLAGLGIGASFLVKLSSALFMPFLLINKSLQTKWTWVISAVSIVALNVLFSFSFNTLFKMSESIDLYFRNFEFNASVYYLLREIGFALTGQNLIRYLGPALSVVSTILILFISFKTRYFVRNDMFKVMCWIALIYLLFSTTVHPWYLIPLLVLMIPAGLSFPILWSFVILLSYSAYSQFPYNENLFFIAFEYAILLLALISEIKQPQWLSVLFVSNADETP